MAPVLLSTLLFRARWTVLPLFVLAGCTSSTSPSAGLSGGPAGGPSADPAPGTPGSSGGPGPTDATPPGLDSGSTGGGYDAADWDGNAAAPSFATDVLPLLQTSCGECHHTGEALDFTRLPFGPGSMDAIVAQMLADVTSKMPPAPRDPMPPSAVAVLAAWKAGGMRP